MPGRLSKWKAQHVGCQKAVDDLKSHYGAEVAILCGLLKRALEDSDHGVGCAIAGETAEPDAECDCWQGDARAFLGESQP